MINLLNKILSRFEFRLVSKEELHKEERCFLDDIKSPEFMNKHPEFLDRYLSAKKNKSLYVGDINYIEDKNGKTYYQDSKNYFWEVIRNKLGFSIDICDEIVCDLENYEEPK